AMVFAQEISMGSMKVRQPVPSAEIDYLDPFVLLHHAQHYFGEDLNLSDEGVGPHPHRGFAPVTFMYKGGIHHRDSRGNSQTVGAGGTQWMHAGMGIVHSERPTEPEQELIQMWINTPAQHKMDQPYYHPLSKEETPFYISEDGKITLNVIAGELSGIKGPIPTFTAINAATVYTQKGGKLFIPLPASHNCFLYLLDGKMMINEEAEARQYYFTVFNNDSDGITIEALEDTRAFLMSGEPIGEKITAQGPFVMNNETQIMEAYRDYRMGKMGVLIEE
ncbi:MAG: pirin family protein, partial [Chitinophagaceae bacterium]|nr:pirin family protein [Chitinophagaceae bacterium]